MRVLSAFCVDDASSACSTASNASSRAVRSVRKGFIEKHSGLGDGGRYMNVIDFDALVAAVLHPEEFAFGSVEISSLERPGPRFGIHGDDNLLAAEDEFHLVISEEGSYPDLGGDVGNEIFEESVP